MQPPQNTQVPPYSTPPFYTTAQFAVLIGSIVVVLFLVGVVVLLYLAHLPGSATTAAIGVIVAVAGPLVGALVLLLRQQFNVDVAIHTAQLVNGHLQETVVEARQQASQSTQPQEGTSGSPTT